MNRPTQIVPQTTEITRLIERAIDKNVPVETMEKLLAMRRELKAEWAREQYQAALAAFQAELPVIKKTRKVMNKDGKTERYRYAPLDSIVAQVKQLLEKHGFSHRTDALIEGKFVTAECVVTHREGHSERSRFAVPIEPTAFMNDAQKYASALTFTKRYAFCGALGILTGDADTDTIEIAAEVERVEQVERPERHRRTTAYEEKTAAPDDPKAASDQETFKTFLAEHGVPPAFVLRLLQDKKYIDGHTKTLAAIKPGVLRRCLDPKSKERLLAAWRSHQADEANGSQAPPSNGPQNAVASDEQPPSRQPIDAGIDLHELLEEEGHDNWRTVPIHYGRNSTGLELGKLPRKTLVWWIAEGHKPKPHNGTWNDKDLLLDAALCLAAQELGGNK